MEKAPVTARGGIQLPFELREKYGISDGGMVVLVETADGVLLKSLDAAFFDSFVGKYADDAPTAEELRAWGDEEIAAEEARIKQSL